MMGRGWAPAGLRTTATTCSTTRPSAGVAPRVAMSRNASMSAILVVLGH